MTATIYAARVMRVDDDGRPFVRIPALSGDEEWGPMPTLVGGLAEGEAIAVTNLGDTRDQMLVLGRMFGRTPGIGEIPGLDEALAGVTGQLDTLATGQSANTALLETHASRLDDIDSDQQTQDNRLTGLDGRVTTAETTNETQDDRLTVIEAKLERRPVGDFEMTWRTTPKEHTLLLHGQEVSKATYADLWAFAQDQGLVGTVFTAGSSDASFRLPDMRGKYLIGAGTSPDGTVELGQIVGKASNVLTLAHLPTHNHRAVTEGYEHSHGPAGDHWHGIFNTQLGDHSGHLPANDITYVNAGPAPRDIGLTRWNASNNTWGGGPHNHTMNTEGEHQHAVDLHIHEVNVDPAGDSSPVENRPPSFGVNWLVWV